MQKLLYVLTAKVNWVLDYAEGLLNTEITRDAIHRVSDSFKNKVQGFNDDQKRRLVDILVEKVLVSHDTEGNKVVDVIFKFAYDSDNSGNSDSEPTMP